jgi:alanine racemase
VSPDPCGPARVIGPDAAESDTAASDTAASVAAGRLRPAWAEIDLATIRHNAAVLAEVAAPARLCAVVKAGGYGHGSVEVADAAVAGGAACVAVALVEEGLELRAAGIDVPILLLSQPTPAAMSQLVAASLTPTLYTSSGLQALRKAVRASGRAAALPVHVKVDTGMHRVGAGAADAVALAVAVDRDPDLMLEGFWTHLAVSEELANPYTAEQLTRFDEALSALSEAGVRPAMRHAANSAAAMWHPASRYDLVRCGIALYGLGPSADTLDRFPMTRLRPALALKAKVSHVKTVAAGERLSYGLRYRLDRDSVVATVPLGYADGVPRALSATGGHVLVGGTRRPISGTVTMDQLLVDCGPGAAVGVGDEVVLLGCQGVEEITAWEWANRTGTIAYEVVCAVSGRVPRVHLGQRAPR